MRNDLVILLKPLYINNLYINNLPEYASIAEFVNQTYKDDKNIDGKIISRILQVIENDLLELYLDFFNSKGLIENCQVALIFDGFQLLINDTINQELLNECRQLALDKTGYDIELKIKPFDNALSLPEDYANSNVMRNKSPKSIAGQEP